MAYMSDKDRDDSSFWMGFVLGCLVGWTAMFIVAVLTTIAFT